MTSTEQSSDYNLPTKKNFSPKAILASLKDKRVRKLKETNERREQRQIRKDLVSAERDKARKRMDALGDGKSVEMWMQEWGQANSEFAVIAQSTGNTKNVKVTFIAPDGTQLVSAKESKYGDYVTLTFSTHNSSKVINVDRRVYASYVKGVKTTGCDAVASELEAVNRSVYLGLGCERF